MVAHQQTRSAGAQIPGGVGRSAQTDDDGCDISIIPQLMNGGWRAEMGGGGWNLEKTLSKRPIDADFERKCKKGVKGRGAKEVGYRDKSKKGIVASNNNICTTSSR